jgi:hypothetical protein
MCVCVCVCMCVHVSKGTRQMQISRQSYAKLSINTENDTEITVNTIWTCQFCISNVTTLYVIYDIYENIVMKQYVA